MNIVWLSYHEATPPKGYWCYGILEETFVDATEFFTMADVPAGEGAVVVLPAEYHVADVEQLNSELATLPWVVLILASDEAGLFPVEALDLPNLRRLWVMTPHFEKHVYPHGTGFLGEGYPLDARALIAQFKSEGYRRPYRCSFSGQITHSRRQKMVDALSRYALINQTAGFTQGLEREKYYRLLVNTQITPAPSGPVTLDSFRAYESLESGGVPVLDLLCPKDCGDGRTYWAAVLGDDHPLPMVEDWSEVISLEPHLPTTFSWWQMHKRAKRHEILSGIPEYSPGTVTVLVPTSPIGSHPSTTMLETTLASIRHHYPDADILIMCDGVRTEQEHYRERYEKYVHEVLWKCNFEWSHVYPLVFAEHQHQANMVREALNHVWTPLVIFMEHDTPLVTDEPIDFQNIERLLTTTSIDLVRFHYEAHIHPEHKHLMLDHETIEVYGVPIRRTIQFSARPHIATTRYYRRIIEDHFPVTSRTMIEDRMHGVAQDDPFYHRYVIYHPETGNIKRSLHLDGRGNDPKYNMRYS